MLIAVDTEDQNGQRKNDKYHAFRKCTLGTDYHVKTHTFSVLYGVNDQHKHNRKNKNDPVPGHQTCCRQIFCHMSEDGSADDLCQIVTCIGYTRAEKHPCYSYKNKYEEN